LAVGRLIIEAVLLITLPVPIAPVPPPLPTCTGTCQELLETLFRGYNRATAFDPVEETGCHG
jgi:hypothetical protein